MGKIVKLVIFWLLTCSFLWSATNYHKQLEMYDAQMKSASSDEMLKVFHGLKSVYIQAIISNDDSLKKETLERLIKSAKVLKLDASKYESELSFMNKSSTKEPVAEKVSPPKKEIEPDASATFQKAPQGKNALRHVNVNEDEIILEFDQKVSSNDIKIFILKSVGNYKKVVDIRAVILSSPKVSVPRKLQSLRVSQYSNDLLRVVMDAPKEFEAQIQASDNKVVISLGSSKIVSEKIVKQPEVITTPVAKKGIRRDKTIVIDAGHGGEDAGATGYKQRKEKHLVLEVAMELGKALKERGYKVYYTRDKDFFIQLRDRTKIANDKNADLFLSIHANAAPNESKQLSMKGIETFFLSPGKSERSKSVAALENQASMDEMDAYSKETFLNVFNREKIILSNKAAIDIQSGMLKNVKKKYSVEDGGVREAPFWVLVGATMPSVLIELGYISNPEECEKLFNPQYQKLLVEGISDGIDKYFNNL
ncbi:MAG: N-acetylmuramoyl-L-alanine amidase [Sulfurospirillaceae bacterium]|nr:N-acetylmuramoyl-L-alanine amidase [Sulfurospirillaceae bacterium]